jgi:hypothetical protein
VRACNINRPTSSPKMCEHPRAVEHTFSLLITLCRTYIMTTEVLFREVPSDMLSHASQIFNIPWRSCVQKQYTHYHITLSKNKSHKKSFTTHKNLQKEQDRCNSGSPVTTSTEAPGIIPSDTST